MIERAALSWLVLLALAIANGAARETLLAPRFGAQFAHVVSTMILSVVIFIAGSLAIPWIAPGTVGEAWMIGVVWVSLTLAFEFLAGHFLFGKAWSLLLADYNILAGKIWVVVLLVTLLTPVLFFTTHAPPDGMTPAAQSR